MKPLHLAVICFLCALGLSVRPLTASVHAQSTATVITIQSFTFVPATTTISAGTTVVWANHDQYDHAPVSDTGVWDAGVVAAGTTSSGTVFNTPGTYPYHCAIHPDMMGTIVVTGTGTGSTTIPTVPAPPAATVSALPTATVPAPPAAIATATPVATLGTTAAATATPTNTSLPLFVKLALGHKIVKVGTKQSIKVTTLAGVAVSIVVTFPNNTKKHHTTITAGTGIATWTFKQPGGRTTRTKHKAKVTATVSDGSYASLKSTKTYTIR